MIKCNPNITIHITTSDLEHLMRLRDVNLLPLKERFYTSISKILGVNIDDELSWEHQIDNSKEKLNFSINIIRRIMNFILL